MDTLKRNTTQDIEEMRMALLRAYPRGIIRGRYILQMSEAQVYAIYKWHRQNKITLNKPRLKDPREQQIPGQTSLF